MIPARHAAPFLCFLLAVAGAPAIAREGMHQVGIATAISDGHVL